MANGLPDINELKKKPLPSKDQLKKKDRSGVSPSPSVSGDSSVVSPQQFKEEYYNAWADAPKTFEQFSDTTVDPESPLPKFNAFIPTNAIEANYNALLSIPSPNPVARNYTAGIIKEGVKAYNRGLSQGQTSTNIKQDNVDIERVAELQSISQKNVATGSYKDFIESDGIGSALKELAKDPPGVLIPLITESFAAQFGSAAGVDPRAVATGAVVGSSIPVVGTASGAMAGAYFDNSLSLETSSFIMEGLSEEGYDITNPQSLEEAFSNDELMSELKRKGTERGLPVAILDALSAGIAGKLGGKTILKKAIRESTTQSALGGAGEAGAQIVESGKITDPVSILAEVIAEPVTSIPEITVGVMESNPELLTKPSSQTVDGRKVLSEAEAEIQEDIANAPEWLKPELARKAEEIVKAKNELVNKDAEFYSGFSDEDKSAVSKINQRLDEVYDVLNQEGISEGTKKAYEAEGNKLIEEKFAIEEKYAKGQTEQPTEQVTEQPKTEDDAVQVSETTEVPSEPEATGVQEVEEEVRGEREGEIPTEQTEVQGEEEVVTEETKNQIAQKIGGVRKTKPKNIKGLFDVMKGVFGLNKDQAEATAVVGDVMIENMAKRAGISKDEMYQKIAFAKAEKAPKGSLKQDSPLTFRSTAKEGLGKIQQKAATPEQWVKQIGEKGGKGTTQELEWIGLQEYLNEWKKENNAKSVPKEVVEQYINDNQIEIVEVTKVGSIPKLVFDTDVEGRWQAEDPTGTFSGDYTIQWLRNESKFELESADGFISLHNSFEEATDRANEHISSNQVGEVEGQIRYSQYQLEGGENYREVLLTLPNADKGDVVSFEDWAKEWFGDVSDLSDNQLYLARKQYESKVGRRSGAIEKGYKSSHWDEANILAHLRINERTLPNGERVMFIEEVQSDWAQEGKKKGFKSKNKQPKLDGETVSVNGEKVGVIRKTTFEMWLGKRLIELTIDELETLRNNPDRMKIYRDEYANNPTYTVENSETGERATYSSKEKALKSFEKDYFKTPDMPYKKTDQWVGMAMRRALKMAADEGFDRVAWVTGEQSAERYDLSKQVDRIEVGDMADGNRSAYVALKDNTDVQLFIDPKTGVVLQSSNKALEGNNLSDVVGKEMSEKILTFDTDKGRVIDGEGLKVGGEGMKAFYNSILPKVAKKEAQRFDKKAKVEVVDFQEGRPFRLKTKEGKKLGNFSGNKNINEAISETAKKEGLKESDIEVDVVKYEGDSKSPKQQLSIAITPEMRMNLNSAVPLFQGEQGAMLAEDGKFIIYALTDPNVSTPLHELAHVYEHYLTEAERNSVLKWAGAKEWTTEVSEKFARGFERYLAEGKAPVVSLQKIFDKFKEWLTDIYNGITGSEIDLKLNKPMTDLYNQMLGEAKGKKEATPERKAELENKQRAENIARKVVDTNFEQLSIDDQNFYEANQELVDSAIQEMQKTKPVEDTKVQSLAEKIVRGAKDFTDEEVDLYAARSEEVEAAKETIASEMEGQKTPPTPQKLLGQIPSKTTKKVDMTDKAVVKQRIQDMVKAANEGYREGRREIKELAKDIKAMMSEVKKGIFTPSQVKALTTRAAEVSTPTQLQKFQDFADKVIESAEYAEDLANAYATRSKVKISNAPSNIQSAFNRFRKVNPSKVDDLAEYNRLAEGLLQYKGKPKVKFQEGVVSAEEKQPIPLREINEYIDKYNNAQAQSIVDDLVSQNELLQQLGLTDEAISPQDAMEIINAITDESPDESVFDRLQNGRRKEEAFKRIVTFNQEDLKNIPQEGITQGDREIKTALENVNIDKLRPSQLSGLYTALQNAISNNSYNGAYRFTSIYKAQQNTPKAQNLQETAARDVSSIDFSISNIPSVVRAITGASKSASELQRLSGMFDIFAGSSKAQRGKEIAAQEVKQLIGDKFKTIEENVFLSMYDTLLTVGRENFDYYKRALNEMIQNDLKSQDTETRKSAEVANKVFQDRIADANNINQIKITAKEKKVSDFFGKKFNSIAPRFKEISENVYNIEFIEAENYRPLLWKKRSRSDVEELTSSYYYNQSIRPNKDGSLNQRTLQVDPNTFSFEYDYVNGMVNKYGSQLLDIETAKPIFDYNYFMKSPDSGKAFGSDGNKQAVNERMKMYINSNKNYVQLPASQKLIVDVANKFAKIGARVKLGGVSQVFMQSIPVFARTITILGRDSVMLTDGVAKRVQSNEAFNRLTDNYSISLRGLLRQEFSSVDKAIPKATRQRWKRRIDTTYIGIDDFLDKLQMLPIETADVQTAKTTWFAYYLKSLKDQGLYDGSQSMENLADNPNDEAAAYAEQMIAETQVPSDVNQNGTYLLPEANNPLSLMRRIAFPFITFRTTQAYSIFNSLYTGSKGLKDKKAGKTAFKEISGIMAENTIFAGMSYGRYLLSLTAGAYLASLLDVDIDNDDEETKKEAYTKWWEKAIAQSLAEINPLYGYGIFDGAQVDAMNKFYFTFILTDEQKSKYINDKELRRAKTDKEYNLVIEKGFKNFSKTKNAPVRDFGAKRGDAWYEQLGQLGFLFEIIGQSKETFQMSEQEQYEYISKWNTTVEVPLSEAERQVLLMSAILQTSNLIAPKEFGDIGRRMKSGIIYKDKSSVSPRRGGGRGSSNRYGGR